MNNKHIKNMVLAAMFLAMGLVLPFLTGQLQAIGNMLLPMHIPVILCGLTCGWQYGLIIGFIMPIMRSVIFFMPMMYPNAISMAFELASYGFFAGFLYNRAKWQCVKMLYKCQLTAMLLGRIVWGIAMMILLGVKGNSFTVSAFLTGAFFNAIPGIVLQLIIIPAVMVALNRAKLVRFRNGMKKVRAKIDGGDIIPAKGIGKILLGMTREELLSIIGHDFSERKISETGTIIEIENAGFWFDNDGRINQIGVWGDFKGKFHSEIGIGSTLLDVEKCAGKWVSVFSTREVEEYPGMCFELGDMDETDDWDEMAAPIERIFVFNP